MEVSSHALAMGRVDGTTFDVAVFTNLSQDHLDFHADLEEYFAAKATLFTPERSRLGVVNVDDAYGQRLVGLAGVPVVTVSPSGGAADWRAEDVDLGPLGSSFVLAGPDGVRLPCATSLAGDFNVANAALAVVALVQAGLDPEQAAVGVASCTGVPGRMERVAAGSGGPLALVDYAHSPDALERLLVTARGLVAERRPARRRHRVRRRPRPAASARAMGAIAARGADVVVLTSDNPRSEDPMDIITAIRRRCRGRARRRCPRLGRRRAGPARGHRRGGVAGRPGRRRRRGGQGPRAGPGGGRRRAPVRRPGRARRGPAGGLPVSEMSLSEMSLAQVAEAVGGTVGGDAGTVVDRALATATPAP